MKRSFFILMVALIAFCTLFVSCNANVEAPVDELVTISFDNDSARALSSNLEAFTPEAYYWKYAAKKADTSNLISGQTANYDSDPEPGALWIKEGEPGFGVTSGALYTPFKVQGFSQGLWNFRLFGYKKVIGDNPATSAVETEYYLLAYSGETTGVLLKQNGTNLVKAIVSPTQAGNGTLVVKITGTDKITLDPATPGPIPNTKIKLKVEKITSTATTTVFEDFVTEDYDESLEAGTYKVTVKFTNDDASVIFASGSVISTVYANLTTTVKGNLTEVVTYADFGADPNPDIITETIGTDAITQGTSSETVSFTSSSQTSKVTASMPTAAAKSLITEMEQALDAKTSTSTSKTSNLTLNLSVNTTAATETTITYEIGMEATLVYEKKDAQSSEKTTTKSTVERLNKFVTVVIDLQENLQDVAVIHGTNSMTSCTQTEFNNKTESDDPNGIGFFYYDSANGKLYIKTWKFSPFQLSYTVPSYVAAIGSVRYTSLKDALDAVVEGDTVTLLKDLDLEVTKEEAVDVDGTYAAFLVRSFKELTFDGNGKTITVRTTDSDVEHVFSLDANGGTGGANIDNVWNIKNLSIDATGFQAAIFSNAELNKTHVANLDNVNIVTDGECIYANGDVTINVKNSSLTHSGEYVTGKDYVYYAAVIVGYDGAINLAGCEISSAGNAIATFPSGGSITLTDCAVTATEVEGKAVSGNVIWSRNDDQSSWPAYTGNSVITVNSGSFDGGIYVSQGWDTNKTEHLYSTVKISGGDFTNFGVNVSHASGCNLAVEDHVVITGGTFDDDPSDYVAEGYIADYNSQTEKWTVREATEDDYVASVTRGELVKKYFSLQSAVAAANAGDTVTLLKSISTTDPISLDVSKALTIDGNNKTITRTLESSDGSYAVTVFNSAGSSVSDNVNVTLKNLNIVATYSMGIDFSGYLNVELNGGEITVANNCVISFGNGGVSGPVRGVVKNITSTMTGNNTGLWNNNALCVAGGAEVCIKSGSFTGPNAVSVWSSGGTITIEGGSFTTNATEAQVSSSNHYLGNSLFADVAASIPSKIIVAENSTATFDGPIHIFHEGGNAGARIYINGGSFTNYEARRDYSTTIVFSYGDIISITGGVFDANPNGSGAGNDLMAYGYYAKYHPATDTAAAYWTVEAIPSDAVFKLINNETQEVKYLNDTVPSKENPLTDSNIYYYTGDHGIPEKHTLVLLRDYTFTALGTEMNYLIQFIGNDITFDLNGHKFTYNGGNAPGCVFVTAADGTQQGIKFKNGIIENPTDYFIRLFHKDYAPNETSFMELLEGVYFKNIYSAWSYNLMEPKWTE